MLLVKTPDKAQLKSIVTRVLAGELSREEVLTWFSAVHARCGWKLPISPHQGYWYFYSLKYITDNEPYVADRYFLRDEDLHEYIADLSALPGEEIADGVKHMRVSELPENELRWPLTILEDAAGLMQRLPGVRGTFETHLDMLEHCHLAYAGAHYLFVRQFDELSPAIMVLGTSRDQDQLAQLVEILERV